MSDLYAYMMRSRNKDNRDVPNFKERSKVFLEYKENEYKILDVFSRFAMRGVDGEKTRLYRSVNCRDENKIRDALLIKLIKDKPDLTKLNSILVSVAQQAENRAESKWLFDFDVDDKTLLDKFISDICKFSGIDSHDIHWYRTPHGYAVIVPHGFDTKELLNDVWKEYEITLKRDELLFLDMIQKR